MDTQELSYELGDEADEQERTRQNDRDYTAGLLRRAKAELERLMRLLKDKEGE